MKSNLVRKQQPQTERKEQARGLEVALAFHLLVKDARRNPHDFVQEWRIPGGAE